MNLEEDRSPMSTANPSGMDALSSASTPDTSSDERPSSASSASSPDFARALMVLRAVGALALLIAGLIASREVYTFMMRAEVESKVLARPNVELAQLRTQEEAKLGSYRWVSKKDGVVRVPLSRAMELTLSDYKSRAVRAP